MARNKNQNRSKQTKPPVQGTPAEAPKRPAPVPRMDRAICPKCSSILSRLTSCGVAVEYRRCKKCHTSYGVNR